MNVVLIGMPGCGKSTIGVLVAQALLMDFADVDLLIQNKYKKTLASMIAEEGSDTFKKKEEEVLSDIDFDNFVIATGGSAVYSDKGMKNLKKNGKVVYLKLTPEEISNRIGDPQKRGVVMKEGMTIRDLYLERAPLYEKYADVTVECDGTTVAECIKLVVEKLKK